MCGIALILELSGGAKPSQRLGGAAGQKLNAALECLGRRGPDGRGVYVDPQGKLLLGHTRLAVMSPTDGAQPLVSRSGRLVVAVNGEIYGGAEAEGGAGAGLRALLISLGHPFQTGSDSEILLHAFEEWGQAAFERLNGELCAVVWEPHSARLSAFRDRYGARSLVYAEHAGRLYLASTAEALFAMGVPRAWDEASMAHALAMQYLPRDRTPFHSVRMLPPGCVLTASAEGVRVRQVCRADWDAPTEEAWGALGERPETTVARFREAFLSAVARRLASDSPLCFHLSGGIDSAAVLGAARELTKSGRVSPRELCAFTASFPGSALDESEFAALSAAHAGATLQVIALSPLDLVEGLESAAALGEGLAVNGHLTAHLALDRAIKQAGFKSVLSGEGADELLSGYPHLELDLAETAGGPGRHLDSGLREPGAALAELRGLMLPTSAELVGSSALGLSGAPIQARFGFVPHFLKAKLGLGARLLSLTREPRRAEEAQAALERFAQLERWQPFVGRHPVDVSASLWTELALGGYILPTLSDRLLGSQGLESRLPFLDPELYHLVRALPLSMRLQAGTAKWILRESVRGLVPDRVRTRRKQPFLAPSLTADPAARAALLELFNPASFSAKTFFDVELVRAQVRALADAPAEAHAAWGPPLFMVATAHALGHAFKLE